MKSEGAGCHVLKIEKHSTWLETLEDLPVEAPLPPVGDVVYRQARHDDVEAPELGKLVIEVVQRQVHLLFVREALPCGLQKRGGDVQANPLDFR